jgi:hypothetical protein
LRNGFGGYHQDDSQPDACQIRNAFWDFGKISPFEESSTGGHARGGVGRVPELAQHFSDHTEVADEHRLVVAECQVGVLAWKIVIR